MTAKERKEALLGIGQRLFALHGYRDVSVRDITEAAGLGTASFYTYFPSKESFYAQIIDRLEQREIKEIERRVGGFQSPLNKLKALFRSIMSDMQRNEILRGVYAREKRFLYPGLAEGTLRETGLPAYFEGLVEKILAEGARKGIFRTSVFRNPKQMLLAIFRSLLMDSRPGSAEDLISDVSLLVERGIKRWLRLRMRDERLDRRASRIPGSPEKQTE